MIGVWLKRLTFSNHFIKFETLTSLLGLTLAVMCVTVTLIIMSSYEATLKTTIVTRTGHVILMHRGGQTSSIQEFEDAIKPFSNHIKSSTPFTSIEALSLSEGETAGVLVEGISLSNTPFVMNLESRIIKGEFIQKSDSALVGKQLASKLNLKINSPFYLAVSEPSNLRPRMKKLFVSGIVDLGRYDFNSRYIAVDLPLAQKLRNSSPNQIMGLRILMHSEKYIEHFLQQFVNHSKYWVQDWRFINQNLFFAIQKEKSIIFFILLVLIVAASFNISNQFSIQVMRRFQDIGILKVMGASSSLVVQLFLIQVLILSMIGIALGFLFAIGICYGLLAYDVWGWLIPSQVYELNQIILKLNPKDFIMVFVFTVMICLLSVWIPVRKATRLLPYEGLRFD